MLEVQESLPGTICPYMSRVVTYPGARSVELTEEERQQILKKEIEWWEKSDKGEWEEKPTLEMIVTTRQERAEVKKLVRQACIGEQCAMWVFGRCGPWTQVHHGTNDYLIFGMERPPTDKQIMELSEILEDTGIKPAFTFPVDSSTTNPVVHEGTTGTAG